MSMPRFQVKPSSLLLRAGLVFLAVTAGNPIYAQAISGDLAGAVTDPSGAFVPAARVRATSAETGLAVTTSTDNRGEYRISNLAAGEWNLTIAASGFAESRVTDIHILLNQTVTVNVALRVAKTGVTVDVVEAGPVIDTTTAQLENSYSERQAEDLPSASTGLGVLNFSLLGTGV